MQRKMVSTNQFNQASMQHINSFTFVPYHEICDLTYENVRLQNYRLKIKDIPEAPLFKNIQEYAVESEFIGGFPTFYGRGKEYRIVLINPNYGTKQDIVGLDQNPADFTVHIRNVDRNLKDDTKQRYLSGFPNFYQSGQSFGAIRLFKKNAGERRWVPAAALGFIETDSNADRMRKTHSYVTSIDNRRFGAGFPTFEHQGQDLYEIILLYREAVTVKDVYFNCMLQL